MTIDPKDKIFIGQRVRVKATFFDPDQPRSRVDPGAVRVKFQSPTGVITTVNATKLDTGIYTGSVVVNAKGEWYWRVESDAPGEAALEDNFYVQDTRF